MMEFGSKSSAWSFEPAIHILRSALSDLQLEPPPKPIDPTVPTEPVSPLLPVQAPSQRGLGDFTEVWKHLGLVEEIDVLKQDKYVYEDSKLSTSLGSDTTAQLAKAVKWRDEFDGADLEDNVEPEQLTASNLRTRKRAARRARARERELQLLQGVVDLASDTSTDDDSGQELEALRRSPDRRALIADLVGRPRPEHHSPPTSPSPPKATNVLRTPTKKEWPVANPFLWATPAVSSSAVKSRILPNDGLTSSQRKVKLISQLSNQFPDEQKYLRNAGLLEPAFSPLNTSPIGVHVFIDMSNISIGFHDCLKLARGIPVSTRIKRIPMNFHNLSLVLERGRPAAKRVLAGSDRNPTVGQAEACGYETNVLDRVHKAKSPTPRKKYRPNGGYNSASGISYGETSGSETPGFTATYKWSEQGVDEILHLKMSHSLLDAEKPSTIVLATGDAAEAEYSDGFLRMVERALSKGWQVEVYSFRANCSSLYRRNEFRQKWGSMFRWIALDPYIEMLVDDEP